MGAFGEKLRNQREQRGLTLDAISNTTKIGVRMLRALEDEQFDLLPGGVFNKGFVRAYARQVGLNEEEAVADYLGAVREIQVQAQSVLPDSRGQTTSDSRDAGGDGGLDFENRRRLNRRSLERRNLERRNLARRNSDPAIAADSENPLPENPGSESHRSENHRSEDHRSEAGRGENNRDHPAQNSRYVGASTRRYSETPPAKAPAPPRARTIPHTPPKLGAAVLLLAAALAAWTFYSRTHTAASTHPAVATHQNDPTLSVPSKPLLPPAANGSVEPSSLATAQPDLTPSIASKHPLNTTNPFAPKPPAPFTVLVRAEKTTWVSIVADGKPVAQETLIAPAHTSVRAIREVVVKTGNAAGMSFLLNGKPIRSQGNEGEVKTYVFNPSGLATAAQAQAPNP